MAPVKRKIVLTKETTDTKIQKRPRTRTCRKMNENSTTTLLEELASEAVSSSQVEAEFSQKQYEEREKEKNKVDDDGERAEEVEEEEGNKKEVEEDKGKQKEVEEEEGKNKEVVEEEEEKINEVDEDKGKQKEVEEDGIKTINAHTFPVHLQPNATGDSIMRSAMGKPFDTFRISRMVWKDIEAFNNYPWGHESFELTVKYLLKPLGPKTNNLFGFPWAFMAWTFEAIPHLTHQVNAEEEISSPRILRWLRSKTKISKNIPDLYNPPHDAVSQEEEKILYQGNTKFEEEDLWRIANGRRRGSVGVQHVNAYKCVTIAEKNKLMDLTKAKELCAQYDMHYFSGEDFRTMTSIDIWWEDWYVDEILSLMREMHVRYPEYYNSTVRILDLNFYSNFKVRYDKMSEEATTVGGKSITQLINEFEWDEDMINYVRGIRPYPGGVDWIGLVQKGFWQS
ncbi:hypothetical protein KY290_027587 [Solanum tuberosum]|uniref:Uncharacterized protein n=1 Tax=Solanum tuberosum TaxID=4113 RepID=A0ABQ7UFG0_SOLTU|nr:hypothetical protein KY290_027587 [Solanum tuberosum]